MTDTPAAVSAYLAKVQNELKSGHAQEHSYRPALKELFEKLTELQVINEPKGSTHGRPDLIFLKNDVPIAWVEAKDLHVHLDKVEKGEQMGRYFGYPNLILTNGLEFRFYKNGESYGDGVILATKHGDTLEMHESAFGIFCRIVADFIADPIDTIRSAEHLAKIMGGKARRLRDNVAAMLDENFTGNKGDVESIKEILTSKLIHDLTVPQFADLYAQTLVYGLFVARYNDNSPENFSRMEAREKIPASNHLLQQFFDHIAGANFVKKLSFIVDELCDVFAHANVHDLVHGLYQQMNIDGQTHDPIIHFYEDFLKEYDPELRMNRGVFYTPLPVVRYIVRSVDALLQQHFGLPDGLADQSQIEITEKVQAQKKMRREMIDRVQVLDPATGTGTFLNEVVRNIHERFKGQEGRWPQYVEEHLIPRLHGFELMMASYTIAHMKLGMTLAETGAANIKKRLKIFLTNSLEEAPDQDGTLFQSIGFQEAITEEADAANRVKRDLPIMVVLGNPPYSVSSQNASTEIGTDGKKHKTWIGKLLDDYKKELNEKKLNLDDDYIKFIRFAHHLIDKNGQGIVAMITNNSFLDGITHRRIRERLLETFDHIYVLDLHGNSKRKEKALDGGKDENVFDIMQGVSINLFVKTGKKKKLGTVHHYDLYGKQEEKYDWLEEHDASNTKWQTLETPEPNFFFVPKDLELQEEYYMNGSLTALFSLHNSGIQTKRDNLCIQMTREEIEDVYQEMKKGNELQIRTKYELPEDGRDWKLPWAIADIKKSEVQTIQMLYRPFDYRWTLYTGNSKGFVAYPRSQVMNHMIGGDNIGLITNRQIASNDWSHIGTTKHMNCHGTFYLGNKGQDYLLPLYLYNDSNANEDNARTPNLNMKLIEPILNRLNLAWIKNGSGMWHAQRGQIADNDDSRLIGNTCGPQDIFDYIYAILHSPTYRERYKEFLKIDFPRVPFTSNKDLFWKLVALGREIRLLHLMESPKLSKLITTFPVAGNNEVEKLKYEKEKVWINPTQYFGEVPQIAWEFPIGGYTPTQKWLKDRKGRTLSNDDILHYQKIIVVLVETGKLMKEIDEKIEENGGFPIL